MCRTDTATGFLGPAPAFIPADTVLHFLPFFLEVEVSGLLRRRRKKKKGPLWIALLLIQYYVAMVMTDLTEGL